MWVPDLHVCHFMFHWNHDSNFVHPPCFSNVEWINKYFAPARVCVCGACVCGCAYDAWLVRCDKSNSTSPISTSPISTSPMFTSPISAVHWFQLHRFPLCRFPLYRSHLQCMRWNSKNARTNSMTICQIYEPYPHLALPPSADLKSTSTESITTKSVLGTLLLRFLLFRMPYLFFASHLNPSSNAVIFSFPYSSHIPTSFQILLNFYTSESLAETRPIHQIFHWKSEMFWNAEITGQKK